MSDPSKFQNNVESKWLQGLEQAISIEKEFGLDSDYHSTMGSINNVDDFWAFYIYLKKYDVFPNPKRSLTPIQRNLMYSFWVWYCTDPVIHYFFIQSVDAIEKSLYIPACSSLLNGIEASLRIMMHRLTKKNEDLFSISPYQVLSNTLIQKADQMGLPISCLKFSHEQDFKQNLYSVKPNIVNVEIVRVRNNICHGNLLEYILKTDTDGEGAFDPVLMKDLALDLVYISYRWIHDLCIFKYANF